LIPESAFSIKATPTSSQHHVAKKERKTSIWLIECVINKTRAQTIGILTTFFRLDCLQ
jgi:hypothetical protein